MVPLRDSLQKLQEAVERVKLIAQMDVEVTQMGVLNSIAPDSFTKAIAISMYSPATAHLGQRITSMVQKSCDENVKRLQEFFLAAADCEHPQVPYLIMNVERAIDSVAGIRPWVSETAKQAWDGITVCLMEVRDITREWAQSPTRVWAQ